MIALSGESRNITAADGILFYDQDLLLFQVVIQCISKPGGEAVDAGPDDNQVFFTIIR